ncbi:hypothetical protein Acr_00g0086330 [Actinidia rufa]|uniref:Uncharacterized protein n=1 Tax=Actinidia rufa TaxID=165716 RepID=A0A7J0DW04_9ERIC|nr:hypothetical protein Acr_00g0086330 [Actinidia rufa]
MQEVAGERGGYLHGRGGIKLFLPLFFGVYLFPYIWIDNLSAASYALVELKHAALDSDDLLYLKEQMDAEEDAERLLRRTEKRAFAAFKISFSASLADSLPASVPLALRVESKPKSGIRQQDLLKKVVEVKPKRQRVSSTSDGNQNTPNLTERGLASQPVAEANEEAMKACPPSGLNKAEDVSQMENPVKRLLAAYESSDDEED